MDEISRPIISLGGTCSIAYQLQKFKKRLVAYPFDWIRTERLSDITTCIQNNFADFLTLKEKYKLDKFPVFDTEAEMFPEETESNDKIYSRIMSNTYKMEFYHDFGPDTDCKSVEEKYKRRIERFMNIIKISKQITFIRDETHPQKIDAKQIDDFLKVIKSVNSILEIKLLIVIHNPKNKKLAILNYKNDENNEVVIINDVSTYGSWTRPNVDWANLFI